MKTVVLAAALFAANLMADVTGTWTGTLVRSDSNESAAHVILKQEGKTLTGSGGPNDGEQHEIAKGTVEGDVVKFEIQLDNGMMKFNLKSAGDSIEGDVIRERDGTESQMGKLTLKRLKK